MSWDAREHDEEVGRMMKEEAGLKDACYWKKSRFRPAFDISSLLHRIILSI